VKSVYDNVFADVLEEKLKSVGFSPQQRELVWNLDSKRVLHFKYGALDEIGATHKGLCQ
jgi:hypothetical protein